MSDHEKKSGSPGTGSSPVVVVSQTSGNRQKQPYRSNELEEETNELHHKRSRAPGVPSVVEELKDVSEESNAKSNLDNNDQKESDRALSHDKQKQNFAKNLSSSTKKYDPSEHLNYETITLAPMKVETKLNPTSVPAKAASSSDLGKESGATHDVEEAAEKKAEEDSITDEVAELRTPETARKQLEWSDEEEAGGLPRSESRASRISRTVRQFFCCGVPYEAPSEDNVSTKRCISGI